MREFARKHSGWIVFIFSIIWTAGVAYGQLSARDYVHDVIAAHEKADEARFREIRRLLWDLKKQRGE